MVEDLQVAAAMAGIATTGWALVALTVRRLLTGKLIPAVIYQAKTAECDELRKALDAERAKFESVLLPTAKLMQQTMGALPLLPLPEHADRKAR